MSDRLNKLQQQKRLIEQHLSWLNQEIEAESANESPPSAVPLQATQPTTISSAPTEPVAPTTTIPEKPATTPLPAEQAISSPPSEPSVDDTKVEAISEELISRYSSESDRREMDPKLGCVLYFVGALGFIIAVVYAIYWFGYR